MGLEEKALTASQAALQSVLNSAAEAVQSVNVSAAHCGLGMVAETLQTNAQTAHQRLFDVKQGAAQALSSVDKSNMQQVVQAAGTTLTQMKQVTTQSCSMQPSACRGGSCTQSSETDGADMFACVRQAYPRPCFLHDPSAPASTCSVQHCTLHNCTSMGTWHNLGWAYALCTSGVTSNCCI
jgi:hypothetical protein